MTPAEIRHICVEAFPLSSTRAAIMDHLDEIIGRLDGTKTVGDLWINGSFLTQKIDPSDVDVLLRLDASFYDGLSTEHRAPIDWLNTNLRGSHRCHSFVILGWPESHSSYWAGEYMYAYWLKQFGFSRSDERKGIALVRLIGGVP